MNAGVDLLCVLQVLEECGGTALGSASGGHESESLFRPSQVELLEFICQTKSAGLVQVGCSS